MADKGRKHPGRDERLAAALRENLKRRKAQERARDRASAVRGPEPKTSDTGRKP